MPLGAGPSEGSGGENLQHVTGVRLRVTGTGNLLMTLFSQDNIRTQVLTSIPMAAATNIQPFRLANFIEQRTQLQLKTTVLDEFFKINRIIVFMKEVYTSYPG